MTQQPAKGDEVFIRAIRYSDGSGTEHVSPNHPAAKIYPVQACVVVSTDSCGLTGCYSLKWASDGKPIGLPFWASDFCDSEGNSV